jgi:hypothetical protein
LRFFYFWRFILNMYLKTAACGNGRQIIEMQKGAILLNVYLLGGTTKRDEPFSAQPYHSRVSYTRHSLLRFSR